MKRVTPKAIVLIAVLALVVLPSALALAQERRAGDQLVYDVSTSGQGGTMGGKTMAITLTFTIKSVDADGTAHADAMVAAPQLPQTGQTPFEVTIAPSGALLPQYDPNMKPTYNMSQAQGSALAANEFALGEINQLKLTNFNGLANACAQRTLHVGDTWQGSLEMPAIPITYKVSGHQQQHGHDVFAVDMEGGEGPASFSAQGQCDVTAHLVVSIHTQLKNATAAEVTDVTLHQ